MFEISSIPTHLCVNSSRLLLCTNCGLRCCEASIFLLLFFDKFLYNLFVQVHTKGRSHYLPMEGGCWSHFKTLPPIVGAKSTFLIALFVSQVSPQTLLSSGLQLLS